MLGGETAPDLGFCVTPCWAGVLPAHAGRLRPRFEKTGLVQDEYRPGVTEGADNVLPQVIPDRVGVPFGTTHQVLQPVEIRIPDLLPNLPGVFALDRTK